MLNVSGVAGGGGVGFFSGAERVGGCWLRTCGPCSKSERVGGCWWRTCGPCSSAECVGGRRCLPCQEISTVKIFSCFVL